MISASNSAFSLRRILVVRLGAMGDVIHTLPAVAALRTMFPLAEIGWAIEKRWADLLATQVQPGARLPLSPEQPLVNTVHLVSTLAWRAAPMSEGTWRASLSAIGELRQAQYDLAIDFQGAWKSVLVALLSRARVRLGFREPREHGAGLFYHRTAIAQGEHIIEQNLSLLSALGPTGPLPENPPLPRDETQELWAAEELAARGLSEFAVINPGAGWGAKQWPAERYAEVARGLAQAGLRSLINFGPKEEELARTVEAASGGAAQPVNCSIGELIALMRRARLFVGGDTGPMHLAALLHVPVVAIFGPTNPARNGPFGTESIVLRSPESRTNHSRRAKTDEAMLSISATEVLSAALTLLKRTQEARRG
jgi:heptosyltransferase-1